ncbi:hypothetical protein BS78_02G069900 [Paspalum vaginatum]|nr:hypothetical protein BS78_02G069900 [Paspalum vaginatum]
MFSVTAHESYSSVNCQLSFPVDPMETSRPLYCILPFPTLAASLAPPARATPSTWLNRTTRPSASSLDGPTLDTGKASGPAEVTAMAPPPRAPPALMDELVEQVLIRLPPSDPASLLRAALVCKPWCRLISAPGFRRRFRDFHRAPPLLGFLCNVGTSTTSCRFVPTSSFRPRRAHHPSWRAIDARHGRVLLHTDRGGPPFGNRFAVWDPITGERTALPTLPEHLERRSWSAAVLCAAGGGACDHRHCRRGPFQVVVVGTDCERVHAYVFSSEAGSWERPASPQLQHAGSHLNLAAPSALVENALYFMFGIGTNLLVYGLDTQELSVLGLPNASCWRRVVLTTTEDGRLGCAIAEDSKIYLWARSAEASSVGDIGWTMSRVIRLEELLPADGLSTSLDVFGYVDGIGLLFVHTDDGLVTIDLKLSQVKKLGDVRGTSSIFPYMSFCTPALELAFTHEGQGVGASST